MGDERRAAATWFTDGSLLEGKAGGAAVRVEGGREAASIVVPLGDGQVCEGEMEGLLAATSAALQAGQTHVLCVADSQAALRGILSTTPRSGQFRAILYDRIIRAALPVYLHLSILNLWTPAHIGTVGNELADVAAKEATTMDSDPLAFVSLTTVRRLVHLQVMDNWDARWKASKTGSALRYINKTPPSLILGQLYSSSLTRRASSSISQLRTGPSFLNAH
jgi:ribonuclease HI